MTPQTPTATAAVIPFGDVATPTAQQLGGLTQRLALVEAGVETRAYVRGGLDPRYAAPAARDEYARELATLAPGVAVAFLTGWAVHRPAVDSEPTATVWHRLIGQTRIEVLCA